jgi:outer membrane protein
MSVSKLKKITLAFSSLLILSTTSAFAADSEGNGAALGKVGYVDLIKVINEAKAAKSIETQINALKAKYQKDAKNKEDALKAREKELADQKKALSKDAFEKKVSEFRKRVETDQKQVMKYQKIIQVAYGKALEALKVQTVKAAGEYAKQNDISLVLPKSQLIYATQSYDITNNVLKMLNDKVPEINISVDENVEKGTSESKKSK